MLCPMRLFQSGASEATTVVLMNAVLNFEFLVYPSTDQVVAVVSYWVRPTDPCSTATPV
jgi:hypothetical protein